MKPYETYCLFLALQMHFTKPSYDFFKYQGKTRASIKTFQSRNDSYQFQKLGKLYSTEAELTTFLVANMIKGKKWVTDMTVSGPIESEENYQRYLKFMESLTYEFQNEVDVLLSKVSKVTDLFATGDNYPPIITEYVAGRIMLPTLVILDDFIGFSTKFDKAYGTDDVMWGKVGFMIKKLRPFVKYDRAKIKSVLENRLLNND